MMNSKTIPYVFFVLALIMLLLFPAQSMEAGKSGLLLWFNIIIPTLFPFMILSYIILHSPIIDLLNKLFSPLLKTLLGVSGSASYALIMGCLSGYPMGAIIVSDLHASKRISKSEATYLLTFCNNASPMFILGFIGASLLGDPSRGALILATVYIGNILTALFFRKFLPVRLLTKTLYDEKASPAFSFSYLDDCISRTADVLVKVGGYIVLFSLPIVFLSSLPIHTVSYQFLVSTIDLSNGVNLLAKSISSQPLKATLLSTLCAFGSLSVVGQTASVIKGSGLSVRKYFYAKLVNAFFTFGCGLVMFYVIV